VVSAVLERLLNDHGQNRKYEVINLSVSGFGQAEQLVTYRELGRHYEADAVLLFYFQNDIGNNAVSGLFEVDDQGRLIRTGRSYLPAVELRERLYAVPPIRWLFEQSALWNLVRNRLSSIVQKQLLKKEGLKAFSDQKPEAVRLTRALISQLIADVNADGALPVVVVIPHRASDNSNFPYSGADIKAMCAKYIDTRGLLTPGDYYTRDSHWRASGHRLTAERLIPVILGQS